MSILLNPGTDMQEEFSAQEQKKDARVWRVQNLVMGIVLIAFGIFFFVYRYFGINPFRREPGPLDFVIGTMFVVYGAFRIYRGVKSSSR